MTKTPDRTFTLKLWADPYLTDQAWDTWQDAVDQAHLEDVLERACQDALTAALPYHYPAHEWHALRAEEVAYSATICPNPAAHGAQARRTAHAPSPPTA